MPGDGAALNVDSTGKKIRTQSRVHPRVWTAATTYYLGEFVRPTAANGRVYRATATSSGNGLNGLSHATTQPTWPTTASGTVVDNQITWTEWGSDLFHDQYSILTDESTGNTARVLNANPASSDYGLATRPIPLARVQRSFATASGGVTGVSTEALLSMVPVTGFVAAAAATAFTVTAGKTFRIQMITMSVRANATANMAQVRLRVNTGGTVITTSPLIVQLTCPAVASVAQVGTTEVATFPDGLDIPAGASFGLGQFCTVTTAAPLVDACIVGYEY